MSEIASSLLECRKWGLVGEDGAERLCFTSFTLLDTASVLVNGQLVMAVNLTAPSLSVNSID